MRSRPMAAALRSSSGQTTTSPRAGEPRKRRSSARRRRQRQADARVGVEPGGDARVHAQRQRRRRRAARRRPRPRPAPAPAPPASHRRRARARRRRRSCASASARGGSLRAARGQRRVDAQRLGGAHLRRLGEAARRRIERPAVGDAPPVELDVELRRARHVPRRQAARAAAARARTAGRTASPAVAAACPRGVDLDGAQRARALGRHQPHLGAAAQPRRPRVRDERRRLGRAATRVAPDVGAGDAHAVGPMKCHGATCSVSASWYANWDDRRSLRSSNHAPRPRGSA